MSFQKIILYFGFLSALIFQISCIPGGDLSGRALIEDFTLTGEIELGCGEDYLLISTDLDTVGCIASCPDSTHIAPSDEVLSFKTDYIATLPTDGSVSLVEDEIPFLQEVDGSKGLCLDDVVKIERPSNQVYIQKDFCACVDSRPDILNNCESYCQNITGSNSTLFGSVKVGPDIELNSILGNLSNWCTKEIGDGLVSPSCTLEVYDGQSTTYLPVVIPSESNTFSVNISNLAYDKTYVAKIIESGSGSNAVSDAFQMRRNKYDDSAIPNSGPLKIMGVSQYTCIRRSGQTDGGTGDEYYDQALKFHYYYPHNNKPAPLEGIDNFLVCHDIVAHGPLDSVLYDRLELIPQHFSIWDQSDMRFFDVDQNNIPDINSQIQDRLLSEFQVTSTVNIFNLFSWPNRPDSDSTPPNVGFYMQAFIDSVTGRSVCPRYNDSGVYYSTDPIFKILKEVVGVNTEGIYLGAREGKTMLDSSGGVIAAPLDILIIREGLLNKIWFYFENGQHYVPNEITASQKTIHFYWPPDTINPYVQKSTQDIYTIRAPEDIGQSGDSTGLITGLRPPDKKFGCVPALD